MGHWGLGHVDVFDIIHEIEGTSDRVTIIIGEFPLVDDRLTTAIEASLSQIDNKHLAGWFGERGFYRDFRRKTDIALMLNVFGEITYADLILLSKARNDMAHQSRHKESATVKGYCRDLKLPERLGKNEPEFDKKIPKRSFLIYGRQNLRLSWSCCPCAQETPKCAPFPSLIFLIPVFLRGDRTQETHA